MIGKIRIMYGKSIYLSGNHYKIVDMNVSVASPAFSKRKTALASDERKYKHGTNLTDAKNAAI